MKIFPADSKQRPAKAASPKADNAPAASSEGKITRKKAPTPLKKDISDVEIKKKLAEHTQKADAEKDVVISKNAKRLGEGFMNADAKPVAVEMVSVEAPVVAPIESDEVKTPNTKDLTIKSDIALNDPKDTNTQEKLKSVLTKGAFGFSPKEREALEKILGN